MALVYHDLTINTAYELILAGLRESAKATTLRELSNYVTNKTDFPAEVCYKIIRDALAEGLQGKTIGQTGELYYAVPPKPPKLPAKRKLCRH